MFDPRRATLRYGLASGRCLGVAWLSLGSAAIAETIARAKPDGIVISPGPATPDDAGRPIFR